MSVGISQAILGYIQTLQCYDDILQFQTTPSNETLYNAMAVAIEAVVTPGTPQYYKTFVPGAPVGLYIYITTADGTVAFNSRFPYDPTSTTTGNNSFYNFSHKQINPDGDNNFNTRTYAMVALLSAAGVGYEQKWSTVALKNLSYGCYRSGISQQNCLGTIITALPTVD